MIPQGFGIIRSAFGPDEVGKAFALFGPVIGLSAVLGPVLGGVLVEADLFDTGWRLIFLVNLPLAAAALIMGARLLPESRSKQPADARPARRGPRDGRGRAARSTR